MAKKQSTPQPTSNKLTTSTPSKAAAPIVTSTPKQPPTISSTAPMTKPSSNTLSPRSSPQEIAIHVWNRYVQDTPSRTLFLDAFLLYIALNGAVQFIYCIIGGNYPFNAFLSGFSAAVGQFVLTISLRMQTTELSPSVGAAKVKNEVVEDKGNSISSERAFADYVFGSLILHGFCVNFIN